MELFEKMALLKRGNSVKERVTNTTDQHEAKRIAMREFAKVLGGGRPVAQAWTDYISAVLVAKLDQDSDFIY